MKKCDSCKWAMLVDEGYSNYTVMGTSFTCLLGVHPEGTFDEFYGEDKRLDYAERCYQFAEGEATHLDVDRQDGPPWSDDAEVEARVIAHERGSELFGDAAIRKLIASEVRSAMRSVNWANAFDVPELRSSRDDTMPIGVRKAIARALTYLPFPKNGLSG